MGGDDKQACQGAKPTSQPPALLLSLSRFQEIDHPCHHHNVSVITPTMTTTAVTVHSTTIITLTNTVPVLSRVSYSENKHTSKCVQRQGQCLWSLWLARSRQALCFWLPPREGHVKSWALFCLVFPMANCTAFLNSYPYPAPILHSLSLRWKNYTDFSEGKKILRKGSAHRGIRGWQAPSHPWSSKTRSL